MKEYKCPKCNSKNLFVKKVGNNTGLYCGDCGAWIKWVGKNELRAFEYLTKQNPYQYSFGVPGQMNQFQQQPVQMPAQPVQQPQQNNNGILWVSGEVGAKSYLVAPGTSVLLMDSESEKFFIKSTDVSGMPQPLRTFEYHEIGTQMPPKQPVQNMDSKYVTRQEYDDLKGKYEAIINRLNSFSEPVRANTVQESAVKGGNANE